MIARKVAEVCWLQGALSNKSSFAKTGQIKLGEDL
jgi:hypothetical protein